ncbi:MAG TPA: hypothetical protein VGE12_12915 [Noviherbaspirillum sp.]
MRKQNQGNADDFQPGIWSSDEYIRAWAKKRGITRGVHHVPLQSLHDYWFAKLSLDEPGRPVERFVAASGRDFDSIASTGERPISVENRKNHPS